MFKLISVTFLDSHDCELTGDSLVEFIRYDEDGKIVNEVIRVCLPEYVPPADEKALREEIIKRFYEGDGETLT